MACGLTIAPDRLEEFHTFLEERLTRDVARARAAQTLLIDLSLTPGGLTPISSRHSMRQGPFGVGWPARAWPWGQCA
jgi:single-stranded-DNA-specific exonuclease